MSVRVSSPATAASNAAYRFNEAVEVLKDLIVFVRKGLVLDKENTVGVHEGGNVVLPLSVARQQLVQCIHLNNTHTHSVMHGSLVSHKGCGMQHSTNLPMSLSFHGLPPPFLARCHLLQTKLEQKMPLCCLLLFLDVLGSFFAAVAPTGVPCTLQVTMYVYVCV